MGTPGTFGLRVCHTRRGGRQSAGWLGKQPCDATRFEVHILRTSPVRGGVNSSPLEHLPSSPTAQKRFLPTQGQGGPARNRLDIYKKSP